VSELFRDADGLRENRERARLKYLFLQHGWTAESFSAGKLKRKLGYKLDPAAPELPPDDVFRDHVGVHPQKQPGLFYVGASVLRGRVTPQQLQTACDLAERYGSGDLRTTNTQNLAVIVNIPREKTAAVVLRWKLLGCTLPRPLSGVARLPARQRVLQTCHYWETKAFTRWLVEEMEERLPAFDQQLKLNVTGCPNSCGQHRIADIGLEGKKLKVNGCIQDAYYFCLGGAVGEHAGFGRHRWVPLHGQ